MPDEEVKQAEPVSPAPVNTQSPPVKGKSKTGLIVVIVLLAVFLVLAVGGYFAYRFVKGKVNTALDEAGSTTIKGDGATVTTGSSSTEQYDQSKDLTPSDTFATTVNNDVKAALSTVFGGAKLNTLSTESSGSAVLYYLTKRDTTTSDGASVSTEMVKKGYVQDSISNSGDGYIIAMTKGSTSLVFSSSDSNTVGVIASRTEQ